MANVISRFWNFMTGWLRHEQGRLEATRPEIVYEQALRDQRKKYNQMEEAVSGLVYNRNRLDQDLDSTRSELDEVQAMLAQAVADAQSDERATSEDAITIGTMLHEQEAALLDRVEQLSESRDAANAQIEEYQGKLVEFQSRVKQLEDEKTRAAAQARVDQETIRLNRELSGMSVDDDTEALNDLREKMGRLHAQAAMTSEMRGKSVEERLQQYKLRARSESSRSEFLARVQASKSIEDANATEKLASGQAETSEKS